MRKNRIDELFDSIEAGDCANIEQQNNQHLTQMKTLLDGHLAQQRNILNEFKDEYKAISNEINGRRGKSPWIVPIPLTKYLSTTEHKERQVVDTMHLRT